MLEKDINDKRIARHKDSQEDFTPQCVIDEMFTLADKQLFKDFTKTYLDTSAGTGNIICAVLRERLKYAKNDQDIIKAVSTLYAVELYEDNLIECKNNMLKLIPENLQDKIIPILNKHIKRGDFIKDDINLIFNS